MLVGYARTSTYDQKAGLDGQIQQLVATGCNDKIFAEQVSSVAERKQLNLALDFVREGDTLVVARLDRLARSTRHFLEIMEQLHDKSVALRILDFGGSAVDSQSATGKMMLTMFSAFAEFERSLLLERQRVGIAQAKREGKYKGRVPTARRQLPEMRKLAEEGLTPPEIAKRLSCSRASVYRLLKEDRA